MCTGSSEDAERASDERLASDLADFRHHLDVVRIAHYVDCAGSHLLAVSRLFSKIGPDGGRAVVEISRLNAYAVMKTVLGTCDAYNERSSLSRHHYVNICSINYL